MVGFGCTSGMRPEVTVQSFSASHEHPVASGLCGGPEHHVLSVSLGSRWYQAVRATLNA